MKRVNFWPRKDLSVTRVLNQLVMFVCVLELGGIRLVVGGLWAEYKLGTCQLPIKKLKAANEKGESSAP